MMDNLSSRRKALVDSVWRGGRRPVVGAFHGALHTQTRQLVESGGDQRDQPVLPSMPGNISIRRSNNCNSKQEHGTENGRGTESPSTSLSLRAKKHTREVRLQQKQIHTVRDLVCVSAKIHCLLSISERGQRGSAQKQAGKPGDFPHRVSRRYYGNDFVSIPA